ncbi:MAG TPA: lipid A export permease/ATP-binding protein MsbA [Woeseiaceae bacterium]
MEVYRRLLGYAMPYWVVMIVAVVAMAASAAVEAGLMLLLKPLTDETFVAHNDAVTRWMPWAFIGIFVARGVAGFGAEFSLGWVGRGVIKSLRHDVFKKFLVLPASYFDRHSSGHLLSKITYNVEMVAESATNVVTVIVRDTLTIIFAVGVMLYNSVRLTLLVAIVVPLIALSVRILSRTFRRYSSRIQDSVGEVSQVTEEVVQGNRVVKVFGGQDYELKRFMQANNKNEKQNMKLVGAKALGVGVTQVLFAFGIAGVVYVAGIESVRSNVTPGTFVSFLGAMILLLQPLRRLTNVNASLQRGIAAADSLFRILDEPAEKDSGSFSKPRIDGDVEFRNVRFTYGRNKEAVIDNLSLRVQPGQTIAIVGRSGGGKSTLVSLLPRFYDVDSGTILVDGVPIEDYRLDNLRSNISLVSQDVVLFNDTIAANLAYGCLEECSEATLREAAEAAFVMDFVKDMPNGLQTIVGDRGVLLSGGQRQRIAIGRALLKNAPILILDEATSALDTESERRIQSALGKLMQNRTTLVIAHRLSTVENADRIIVMDQGRIIEAGTHSELLARNGQYASLYNMQFSDE